MPGRRGTGSVRHRPPSPRSVALAGHPRWVWLPGIRRWPGWIARRHRPPGRREWEERRHGSPGRWSRPGGQDEPQRLELEGETERRRSPSPETPEARFTGLDIASVKKVGPGLPG